MEKTHRLWGSSRSLVSDVDLYLCISKLLKWFALQVVRFDLRSLSNAHSSGFNWIIWMILLLFVCSNAQSQLSIAENRYLAYANGTQPMSNNYTSTSTMIKISGRKAFRNIQSVTIAIRQNMTLSTLCFYDGRSKTRAKIIIIINLFIFTIIMTNLIIFIFV